LPIYFVGFIQLGAWRALWFLIFCSLLVVRVLHRCYKRGAYVRENRLAAQVITATKGVMR
jgi:hypothetical protein